MARSQHVVHVLPPGDARAASVVGAQVQRVDGEVSGVQVLVLTPSAETAAWIARLVNPTVEAGHVLLVPMTAPARAARRVAAGVGALAGTPSDALALVRGSALKLDAVRTVIIMDANELLAEYGEAAANLLSELPKEAERIILARESDDVLEAFIEAHMRRARRMEHTALATSGGAVQYLVAARGERAPTLRRILDTLDPARATIVATADAVSDVAHALASIGYAPNDETVRISTDAIPTHEPLVIFYSAPLSASALQTVAATTPKATVAIVAPEDLATFLRATGGMATPLSLSSAPVAARAAEESLRDELRAVLRSRALHRETLAIEPLLVEHDAVEVAAAALRLLEVERERARAKRPAKSAEAPVVNAPTERVAPAGTSFTKLFINVGERDGAKKGDFVGAITGEAGVGAEQIGKIELRDSHTLAEVASEVAEKVIAALTGSTIRGRHVLAREDRGPSEREVGERSPDRDGERSGGFRSADRGDRGADRGGDRGGYKGASSGGYKGAGSGGYKGAGGGGYKGASSGGYKGAGGGGYKGAGGGGYKGAGSGGYKGAGGGGYKGAGGGGFRSGDSSDRAPRSGPPRSGSSERSGGFRGPDRPSRGYAGGGERGGFRGSDRNRSSSDSAGGFGGGDRGGFRGPPSDRGPRRDDAGGVQRGSMQRDDTRGPRAIGESKEWGNRGDSLRNARGKRSED
ncbi:MAG: DbpA RNA binding domain-containing protein [Gemmatimonadaceae bacterium]|nr:DbpA RNA binding domain-containing protein [Gemmatimonadaceae bacterium]